jgi:undecaprenyl diphosphate synthase
MAEKVNFPSHVGIIMDGNGRWAELRGKKRTFGHKEGSKNVDRIVEHAFAKGVRTLTLYAFSSENWARPKEEVDALMILLKTYFTKFMKKVLKNNVRLNVIGDISVLTKDLQEIILDDMEKSKHNTERILNVAINYGGRQEIVYAVNKLIKENKEITVENISSALYTAEFGEPDLIIRTGGELRTSNFLIYQGAYSELYFTKVLWPDFDGAELDLALEEFSKRKRRFGKI